MRRKVERQKRAELAWMLAGFIVVQMGLAVGVEYLWPRARDPEFELVLGQLQECLSNSPGRPLVLALGSSRTLMGLRAQHLSHATGTADPLVFNFAIPASGPMMQMVALRRVLAAGVRPNIVIVEAMPMSFSQLRGAALEERQLDPARLDAVEVARLYRFYNQPYRLVGQWAAARALPVYRHQAELREALGLDVAREPGASRRADSHGWRGFLENLTADQVAARTRYALDQYEGVFQNFTISDRPQEALRHLLHVCRKERLTSAVVIPPEGSAFRALYPAEATVDSAINRVVADYAMPLHDARRWVDDEGFWDGHHMCVRGADQYTERFGREVLLPLLEAHGLQQAHGLQSVGLRHLRSSFSSTTPTHPPSHGRECSGTH